MKYSYLKKSAALFLAAATIFTCLPGQAYAAKATADTETTDETEAVDLTNATKITTADQLVELAGKCKLGSFSKGQIYSLEADIDLSQEKNFEGFSSFSGSFYGNGHTISGLTIEKGNGAVGLFGYLEEGALVQDLSVDGMVMSEDSNDYIGMIAGVNAGVIKNCTVSGMVVGRGITGGIAGLNGGAGYVLGCINEAQIDSLCSVGGIVGENRGTVADCENAGMVNGDSEWLTMEDDAVTSLTLEGIMDYLKDEADNQSDMGGIAGYSYGTIAGCTNSGTVGYQHAGKNVGGIAGRQEGTISDCSNQGKVYGKQDVGGIVGQFEPELLQQGPSIEDRIKSSTKELNRVSRQATQNISSASQDIQNDLNSASQDITDRDKVTRPSATISDMQNKLQQTQDSIDQLKDTADEKTTELKDKAKDASKEEIRQKAKDTADTIKDKAKSTSKDVREDGESAINEVKSTTDEYYDKASEKIDGAASDLSDASNKVGQYSSELVETINDLNDSISDMNSLALDELDNLKKIANGGDVIEDYSAIESDDENASRVKNCTSSGYVGGDRNVGGIAGNIDIDGRDAEDQSTEETGQKYVTVAVLENCDFSGIIEIRKENAGGIVGNASLGLITGCESLGRIIGDDANYIGGIAGYSKGTITDCNAIAELEGSSYIGGIAGAANKARNSYSMTAIVGAKGWTGAILGDIITSDDADITVIHGHMMDSIYGNYYVSDSLQGINGVSYDGIAQALSYEELMATEGISSSFSNLTITYRDSDYGIVKTSKLAYGHSLADIDYPDLAEGSDEYSEWEGLYSDTMTGNVVLLESATDQVTVLASDLTLDDRPVALASGNYFENSKLEVTEYEDATVPGQNQNREIHSYKVSLKYTAVGVDTENLIRFYNQADGDIAVYQLIDSKWVKKDLTSHGSYVETSFTGAEGVFAVETWQSVSYMPYICAVAAAVLLILVIFIIVRRRKNGKTRSKESQ